MDRKELGDVLDGVAMGTAAAVAGVGLVLAVVNMPIRWALYFAAAVAAALISITIWRGYLAIRRRLPSPTAIEGKG